MHRESLRRMRSAGARLSAQERCVLDRRFGLAGEEPRTLQETGTRLQLSHERVRQVEHQAIARLKRTLDPRYPRPHVRPTSAPRPGPAASDLAL